MTPAAPPSSPVARALDRGLDAEGLARVMCPKPVWLTDTPEYRPFLRTADGDDDFTSQAFSNLDINPSNKPIVASEWQGQYFLMHGRVHHYPLTWDLDLGFQTSV
ncbi:hypothetical protein HIM_11957 [Hirsutella minnesotensis 3608]|uniref:Uncharacterized protein n=1 Tax=Hirsutella minnesotensis 3608 TaxID=1043627 RepID=A0A0F7ZF75_9HYPO|nr:hypothetical protein HIM_11957 [Hirsutella minnesotensis 3608]